MAIQEQLNSLEKENKKLEDFIFGIERECNELSEQILTKMCNRAIKAMNELDPQLAASVDEYPSKFGLNYFDILCIEYELDRGGEEIDDARNETIENFLKDEYDKLPPVERFILDHSESWALMEDDETKVMDKIKEAFTEIRFKHVKLSKIQKYMEKY